MSDQRPLICRPPTPDEAEALARDFPEFVKPKGTWGGGANRAKTHCPHGHPLSGENLYVPPGQPTWRQCRECKRQTARKSGRRDTMQKTPEEIAAGLSPTQKAWVLDLERGEITEPRRGSRASAVALNPLLGSSSGEAGPDVVCVDYGTPSSRTWDLTPLGRQVAAVLRGEAGNTG